MGKKAVNVRVEEETLEAAQAKAQQRGVSLSGVIQSFIHLFANDETPPGWPPIIPEATARTKETKPRRRRKKGEEEE